VEPAAGAVRLGPGEDRWRVSEFSWVDGSEQPAALLQYLDHAAAAEAGMKQYAVAAHALRRPAGPILDVGCGAGHDLALLHAAGLAPIGVDPSEVMLTAARERVGSARPIVRAAGEALPFADGSVAGCRIERVLIHVVDPLAVLAEAVRCVTAGGLVTVLEPDWGSFVVRSDTLPERATWISSVRHPAIGARLWDLLEQAGCDVLDRVEELSVWRSVTRLAQVAGFPMSVERAVAAGRVDAGDARRWIDEQRRRDDAGEFYALLPKVQVVAQKR